MKATAQPTAHEVAALASGEKPETRFDSPLTAEVEPIVLLPTVTLSPTRSVASGEPSSESRPSVRPPTVTPTPDPALLAAPTAAGATLPVTDLEMYPIPATESGWQQFTFLGITYTERSEAGFGNFAVNTVSPCLCLTSQDESECSQEIELYRLSAYPAGVVSSEACTSVELNDDRIVTFKPITPTEGIGYVSYTYGKPLPEIGYHLLMAGYWEGADSLLLNNATGEIAVFPGYPQFSPEYRRFALIPPLSFSVQIWNIHDDGPHFEAGWRLEGLHWGFETVSPLLTWENSDRLQIQWPLPQGVADPPSEPVEITVVQEGDRWTLTYEGKPILRPVVDYRTIKFANEVFDHKERLGKLQAGQPVYTDQRYLFTSVPDELEGATYFRIPQNYNLGEEPSYFPLEAQMSDYLDFQVTRPATVYVALDAIVDDRPEWMDAAWAPAGIKLETNDIPLRLFRKEFAAGEWVKLVDKWMMEDRVPSQFVVIVTPNEVTPNEVTPNDE